MHVRGGAKVDLLDEDNLTLSEKIQWLALNYWYNHPARYYINDKYLFRYYWNTMMDEDITVPVLGVYEVADDISFQELPQKFVLKRTLGGGGHEVKVCDQRVDNESDIRNLVYKWLNKTLNGKARVIAEEYLESAHNLVDYRFYVSRGEVKLYFLSYWKDHVGGELRRLFFDLNWNRLDTNKKSSEEIILPGNFDKMVKIAEEVGKYFPLIRVDMYNIEGKIYIGELTGVPNNGIPYFPFEEDLRIGRYFNLPTENEILIDYEQVLIKFPELKENPILLKGKNGRYRLIMSDKEKLPLPPENYLQPRNKNG